MADRYTKLPSNQIKDRSIKKGDLDATGETVEKVATVQSDGSVDWEFVKSLSDADNDTKIQVEESADEDTIRMDVAGTQEAQLDQNGLTLKSGASVNEFSTDGTLAGDSDDVVPTEKAVKTYVDANAGGSGALSLISATSISSSNSGDISISPSKLYKILISLTNISADDSIVLRFNSDSGTQYDYYRESLNLSQTYIYLGDMDGDISTAKFLTADIHLDTFAVGNVKAKIVGQIISAEKVGGQMDFVNIGGKYQKSTTISSFEILTTGSANLTGTIYLYEYTLTT